MTDELVSDWENFINNINFLNVARNVSYTDAKAKGWHQNEDGEDIPNFGNYTSNITSEVTELWNAWCKGELNKQCDKAEKMQLNGLVPLTCAEEEIADILIRTFDTAARLNVDVAKAVFNKLLFNRTRPHRHGGKRA